MAKLESVFPKDSAFLSVLYPTAFCTILFDLSWMNVLLVILIDIVSFLLVKRPEIEIFYALYPHFKEIRNFNENAKKKKDYKSQNAFFHLLAEYPEQRAVYAFIGSLLKVLPVGIFIASHSNVTHSFWENLLLFYVADIFILIYHHCFLYIALHHEASKMMSELTCENNWKENYRDLNLTELRDRFSDVHNIVMMALLINLLGMVFYTVHLGSVYTNEYMAVIFLIAILCIGKVQFSFQKFFRDSLVSIFEVFSQDISESKIGTVPLHTSPMLANFEYTFNQLSMKLEEREKEVSQWLKHESEQFHLKALGEVTAMVAHDMKTPLHVMSMSLEMLSDEKISDEKRLKYQKILKKNLDLSISFSHTLMAYLRGNKGEMSCAFGDVHRHLLDLFKTQFFEADLSKIRFNISDELMDLKLKVSRLDAMHVFYNLYQNAIKSTLVQHPAEMVISLWSELDSDSNIANIYIENSGMSLDPATFYRLIRFERFGSNSEFYHGLGLRLTNSILQHLEGSFDIVPGITGTCLKVSLRASTESFTPDERPLTEWTLH